MEQQHANPAVYKVSVNIYGRGDAMQGDSPSHVGIAIHQIGSSTCEMYHIRNPNDTDFIFDPREQPLEDPVLRGRCEIATLTPQDKEHAVRLLTTFGNDKSNIPEYGVGNCQDWLANAIASLESEGLFDSGEGRFWKSMINQSADGIRGHCIETGRKWIPGAEVVLGGDPDARFCDTEDMKPVGKLAQNPLLQAHIQSILGQQKASKGLGDDRPFYMSSPFFSQTNSRR